MKPQTNNNVILSTQKKYCKEIVYRHRKILEYEYVLKNVIFFVKLLFFKDIFYSVEIEIVYTYKMNELTHISGVIRF